MAIDYRRLRDWRFAPVEQDYDEAFCILYALALNIGADPLDERQLPFVTEDGLRVMPTLATVLARLGPWMRDPEAGIDYRRVVVGEVAAAFHAPIPPSGRVRAEHAVTRVVDKGEGRGALVTVEKRLLDAAGGTHLATYVQTTFCRADGGFARHGGSDPEPPRSTWDFAARPPDLVRDLPTLPQQALLYRLTGDRNPLHSDPGTARAAGFDRPILHGLASFGMLAHAVIAAACDHDPDRLAGLSGRFSAPVHPGETIRLSLWRVEDGVRLRATVPARDATVFDQGHARLR